MKIYSAWAANAVPVAEYMKLEYERFVSGAQCRYEVTLQMLDTMA